MAYSGHHQAFASEILRITSSVISGLSLPSIFSSDSLLANISNENPSKQTMGSVSDIRALEHQTLKVPYELLNKKFRVAQKSIDREASHVQINLSELEKAVKQTQENGSEQVTIGKINEILIGVVNRLTVLKRKAVEGMSDELEATNVCKRRLEHLKEYCNKSSAMESDHPHFLNIPLNDPFLTNWKQQRMDRMLVDHCLRNGFYETALELSRYSNIEHLTNIDIFLLCREIEDSLLNHETSRCLSWCHENRSKLRKVKSTLEFSLRQQEFIELVRTNKRIEAVMYAQKHFNTTDDIGSAVTQNELEQTFGLLACKDPNTQVERYKVLFDENRWQKLIEQFRLENFKLYQLSNASVFSITLQAGLSSLKTPHCYRKEGARNSECPVCSELLNKLAATLPCAHCSQSRLVCFISGEPMNEHNQPLMLPNGHVYGEKSLKKMASDSNGKVSCPRTGDVFDIKEAEKVYVM